MFKNEFFDLNRGEYIKKIDSFHMDSPFRRFSTCLWQNAHVNTVRCAMMYDMHFPFPKML